MWLQNKNRCCSLIYKNIWFWPCCKIKWQLKQTQSCKLFRFLILKLNHPEVPSLLERTGDHWRSNNLTEFLSPAEIPKSLFILEDVSLKSNIHFLSWVWICVPNARKLAMSVGVWLEGLIHCTDSLPGKSTDWSCCMCEYTLYVCTYLYLCCDSMCCLQWRKLTFKERLYAVPPPIVELVVPNVTLLGIISWAAIEN